MIETRLQNVIMFQLIFLSWYQSNMTENLTFDILNMSVPVSPTDKSGLSFCYNYVTSQSRPSRRQHQRSTLLVWFILWREEEQKAEQEAEQEPPASKTVRPEKVGPDELASLVLTTEGPSAWQSDHHGGWRIIIPLLAPLEINNVRRNTEHFKLQEHLQLGRPVTLSAPSCSTYSNSLTRGKIWNFTC